MSDRKVVETSTEARQGRPGRPMLIVLVAGLALALVAWLGAEMWGEATDAPAEQTATPPAQSNAPETPAPQSTTPAVPAPTDQTTHPDGGTGGESQTNQPAGSTTRP
jgi:hypothetical protein